MSFSFDEVFAILDDSEFEEVPVDIDTFISDERYLNRSEVTLSPIQRDAVLNSTQIYKKETLEKYLSPEEAQRRWAQTNREVILMLGKGSGKDFLSGISCCYIIYLLLYLKDPSRYYGKPSGDSIDILNIAINAAQASNVFFSNVSTLITKSTWFKGKYDANPSGQPARQNVFNFNKNINLYSGHSEREAWEGLNCFMAVLDEISGFALESASVQGKTAESIYKMHRASVDSRFPHFGKVVMLSFPRFKGDFISQRYDQVIASKQVIKRSAVLKLDDELPDGIEGNEITIEWDEDHIEAYRFRGFYALRRPTWDVNPSRRIDDFTISFADDYVDSLGRFACMPPEAVDAFFKDRTKIEEAFHNPNGVINEGENTGAFRWDFEPDEDKLYFVHVDLAQKHDRCAVALAHIDRWATRRFGDKVTEPAPVVIVDALRFWEPTKNKEVDFTEVQEYIVSLQRKGFNLKLVTFDQWRCTLGTTMLSTSHGPVTMADINEGDEVLTRHGPTIVGGKFDTGIQEVFRIKTSFGYEFEATANHKMLTKAGWKTIRDLTLDDELLLNNSSFPDPEDTITTDQAYALGALIAGGWINDQAVALTTPDKDFLDKFDTAMKSGWGFKNNTQKKLCDGCWTWSYYDKEMILRMREAGFDNKPSHARAVPHSVLNGSRAVKAAFIAGFVDDGGIHNYVDPNGQPRIKVEINTVSETLAKQFAWMLLSMGLEPSRQRLKGSDNVGEAHRFVFDGRRADRFFEQVYPAIARKFANVNSRETEEQETFQNNELWVKVTDISSIGEHQTYDINVPEYNEFIADGFVTHNSEDMRKYLNSVGIRTELLSVKKEQYVDMAVIMNESRLEGPDEKKLRDELLQLRLFPNGKIDHMRSGYKDLSDATCGAIFNALTRTPRELNREIEVRTIRDYKRERNEAASEESVKRNVIKAPKREPMPSDIASYLRSMRVI